MSAIPEEDPDEDRGDRVFRFLGEPFQYAAATAEPPK